MKKKHHWMRFQLVKSESRPLDECRQKKRKSYEFHQPIMPPRPGERGEFDNSLSSSSTFFAIAIARGESVERALFGPLRPLPLLDEARTAASGGSTSGVSKEI